MPFVKGWEGGPGRPKDAKDKKLYFALKNRLTDILVDRIDDYVANLEMLQGKEYCDAYTAAARLVIPKDVDLTTNEGERTIEDLLISLSETSAN